MLSSIVRNRASVGAPSLSNMMQKLVISRFPAARSIHASSARLSYPVDKKGRPLRTYARFSKENYSEIAAENPSLAFGEIGRKLGDLWRSLPSVDKDRYVKEYEEAIDAWKAAKASRK